jgi:glycosyltransferase involved in cell wall biosynthesis
VPSSVAPRSGWLNDLDEIVGPRPDIVHVHDGAAAVAGWSLAGRLGKLVRTQHFVRTASSERGGWRRVASLALHRALNVDVDALVAVSQSAATAAEARREVSGEKVTVIPPGIDLPGDEEVERAIADRLRAPDPVVAYVGRLEREKSVDLLLCAVPLVLRHLPGCKFVIAGAGSCGRELKELARKLKLERNVVFLGEVEDPAAVLARAHVFVNPSSEEGYGLAVAEALAWALPVVAVRSGGVAELVEDQATGLLADTADPHELAAAIIRLAADRELAEELGTRARRRALTTLGGDRTAELTLDLYKRLAP